MPTKREAGSRWVVHFNGQVLRTYVWRGRPCWLATAMSRALGFGHATQIVEYLRGEWAEKLDEGDNYARLAPPRFRDFRAENGDPPELSGAKEDCVLFESGVYVVLSNTKMDKAKALRRAMSKQVFSRLADDSDKVQAPTRVSVGEIVVDRALDTETRLRAMELELRKHEIDERGHERKLREREIAERGFELMCSELSYLPPNLIAMLVVKRGELLTGMQFPQLLPRADDGAQWESPTHIAERNGVSLKMIGEIISKLGLRDKVGFCRAIPSKGKHSNKQVKCYEYSPQAVAVIEGILAIERAPSPQTSLDLH